MTWLNIPLLAIVMLLVGWQSRGVWDSKTMAAEIDRRLTDDIRSGIQSGLLTVHDDVPYGHAAGTNLPTAMPPLGIASRSGTAGGW